MDIKLEKVNSVKHILKYLLGFGIVLATISCQDEPISDFSVLPELNIKPVVLTDENVELNIDAAGFSRITWEISDGSYYDSPSANHKFVKSGIFNIKAIGYSGNQKVDSTSQSITVYASSHFISLGSDFFALRSKMVSKVIVVEGLFKGEDHLSYLKFDEDLNLEGIYKSELELGMQVFEHVVINGEEFSYDNHTSIDVKSGAKSTDAEFEPENYYPNEIMSYSSGFARFYEDENADSHIDYYSTNLEKLWTKTFSGEGKESKKFIANLNDVLYYISFDINSDVLHIDKFKNVSLSYQKEAFNIGFSSTERDVLFTKTNQLKERLEIAIFSNSTNSTIVYGIDENCRLNIVNEIPGYLNGKPIGSRLDGTCLVKESSKVVKYDANWNRINEHQFSSIYSSISQLGDNLYLTCESVDGGISLAYLDKNLQRVAF